jgi:Uma2 family endonuclease
MRNAMTIQERISTIADLRALDGLPENQEKRFELLKGVIYEVPYPSPTHNLIVGNIYSPLRTFVKTQKLGFVFTDTVSYSLPNIAYTASPTLAQAFCPCT